MNKIMLKSLLACILIMTLLITSTGVFALSPSELARQEGEEHGTRFGEIDGSQAAEDDYALNLSSNSSRNKPKSSEVISKYHLNRDSGTYQSYFVNSYLAAYDLAYQSTYRQKNMNQFIEPMDSGSNDGLSLGEVQGAIHAVLDFNRNLDSDWDKAYTNFIRESSLNARYYLDRDTDLYQSSFERAFKDNFRLSYISTYQERNIDSEKLNINLVNLQNEGAEILFDDDHFSVENASITVENRNPMTLNVPEGAVYKTVPIQMYKLQHSDHLNQVYKDLESVSSAYTISVANAAAYTIFNKPVELSFEYYGSEYAGIYLWNNNRWEYQYTNFDEDRIYTKLPTGYYGGGTYAIFIDSTAKNLTKSSYHWARQEAYTFMRRNILEKGSLDNLNNYVTRREFAEILYKSLGDNLSTTRKPVFSDVDSFGDSKAAIEYVVAFRYLFNDENNAFRPNEYITYKDLEKVFSNMYYREFKWQEIGQDILYDKYIRSKGLQDTTLRVPLGEVIYALNHYLK